MSVPAEWFRNWFGSAYLALYPHRNEEEAAAGVDLFLARARPSGSARVLDLACGSGRHLDRLRASGLRAVGLDLSPELLREARRRPDVSGALVRGDMRALPFGDEAFDGLVSFFTSFGYFHTPEEDRAVVSEMRRVLRGGAAFLIDYLNARRVRERLEPETVSETEEGLVRQIRWLEGDQVVKRIEIVEEGGTEVYHERVRLYEPGELTELLAKRGLDVEARMGGYDGRPFHQDASRLLLLGRAT